MIFFKRNKFLIYIFLNFIYIYNKALIIKEIANYTIFNRVKRDYSRQIVFFKSKVYKINLKDLLIVFNKLRL